MLRVEGFGSNRAARPLCSKIEELAMLRTLHSCLISKEIRTQSKGPMEQVVSIGEWVSFVATVAPRRKWANVFVIIALCHKFEDFERATID